MINLLSLFKKTRKTKYHHHLSSGQTEEILNRVLAHQTKILETLTLKSAVALDEGIKDSMAQIRAHIQKRFDEYFLKIQQELDKYKQDKEASIDENANKLLREVIRKALPEVVSSEDHTQIVLDSLEKAKKEGLNL